MRNPLRTGAATPEPAPLVDTLAAINVTLANVKSDRLIRLESAARVAADERANAASLYRIAHGEACNLQPNRPKEMPSEREARLALETAEKRSHEARRALREARAADLPAFQRAVDEHLAQLVAPLSQAADLIDAAHAVLSTIDNYTMRHAVPAESLAPRFAGTALLRQEIARLPGGETKAAKARRALADMGRAVGAER
ncbi:MAG: hypothetical protein K0R41_3209 [Geminicoccaceae bacterium]|nr:hypothetical protein [Geminicoccaceae bacterium]